MIRLSGCGDQDLRIQGIEYRISKVKNPCQLVSIRVYENPVWKNKACPERSRMGQFQKESVLFQSLQWRSPRPPASRWQRKVICKNKANLHHLEEPLSIRVNLCHMYSCSKLLQKFLKCTKIRINSQKPSKTMSKYVSRRGIFMVIWKNKPNPGRWQEILNGSNYEKQTQSLRSSRARR